MRSPNIIEMTPAWLESLEDQNTDIGSNGEPIWVPSRPLGMSSLRYRLKAAWLVFTGRADALKWPGQ